MAHAGFYLKLFEHFYSLQNNLVYMYHLILAQVCEAVIDYSFGWLD